MDGANAVFDDIDADKSGEIDPAELMMHLLGVRQEPGLLCLSLCEAVTSP